VRLVCHLPTLIVLAAITGCAPAGPPKVAVQPASVSTGTILSMRAVYSYGDQAPLRAVLLSDGAQPTDRNSPLVEFIVRADDGATLSIVQVNADGFHTGERVIIVHGDYTHLARPG
jgi:outer membrane lipoprotein SlyB